MAGQSTNVVARKRAPPPARRELTQREIIDLTEVLAASVDAFGSLMTSLGKVELTAGARFSDIAKRFAAKEFVAEAVKLLTPEELGLLLRIMMGLTSLGDLSLDQLSPEEKIEKGKSMHALSGDINELIELMKRTDTTAREGSSGTVG